MKNIKLAIFGLTVLAANYINGYPADTTKLGDNMTDKNLSEQIIVPELETFYMCLLKRGPNWTADESPESINLQDMHLQHLSELMDSGQLLLAGPFAGGMCVFKVASLDDAQLLMKNDPKVIAGHLVLEWYTWLIPKGILN